MKRSDINALLASAQRCFQAHGWALPPAPRWDVTDFGLGDWRRRGLVLVNLAEEPEYCEKLMYARQGMETPAHCHGRKKEDIVCRWGRLSVRVWPGLPSGTEGRPLFLPVDGAPREVLAGAPVELQAGSRVTLVPGVYHSFEPLSGECILGEVSTANDDLHDNFFADPAVGRDPVIEEDEPATVRLLSEHRAAAISSAR